MRSASWKKFWKGEEEHQTEETGLLFGFFLIQARSESSRKSFRFRCTRPVYIHLKYYYSVSFYLFQFPILLRTIKFIGIPFSIFSSIYRSKAGRKYSPTDKSQLFCHYCSLNWKNRGFSSFCSDYLHLIASPFAYNTPPLLCTLDCAELLEKRLSIDIVPPRDNLYIHNCFWSSSFPLSRNIVAVSNRGGCPGRIVLCFRIHPTLIKVQLAPL